MWLHSVTMTCSIVEPIQVMQFNSQHYLLKKKKKVIHYSSKHCISFLNPFSISALLSPLNLVSLSIIIVVLWVCGSHFELRSGICCVEIKEDQKITNAFNLGFTRECNDPPAMELLARSHMKSLDQWPHTSHPLFSPSLPLSPLSPSLGLICFAEAGALHSLSKKPLQTGACKYSRFSSWVLTRESSFVSSWKATNVPKVYDSQKTLSDTFF